jgi:hypothetical protein
MPAPRAYNLLVMALVMIAACDGTTGKTGSSAEDSSAVTGNIEDVLARHTEALMAIPGVVGTGQGLQDDRPCILVFVKEKTADLERAIPSRLEGYPVRIEEVGEVRPLR